MNTVKAFAKINLSLSLGNKRADGFHEIKTVLQTISLFDSLTFRKTNKRSYAIIDGKYTDVPANGNIALKALDLIKKFANITDNYEVRITKRIPVQAGMGGGSSDAWSVFEYIAAKYDLKKKSSDLLKLASRLGSDIPFFYFKGRVLAEGRGEILTPLEDAEKKYLLIVKPPFGISTEEAYKLWDEYCDKNKLNSAVPYVYEYKNDFEKAIFKKYPSLENIKKRMLVLNAKHALMTGSGSAVIGLFKDKNDQKEASSDQELNESGDVIIAETLGKEELKS